MKQPQDHRTIDAWGRPPGRPPNEERGLPPAKTGAQRTAAYRRRQQLQRRLVAQAAREYFASHTDRTVEEALAGALYSLKEPENYMPAWVELGRRNGWLK